MKRQIKTILEQTNDVVQSIDPDAHVNIIIKQDDDILSIHIETTGHEQAKKHLVGLRYRIKSLVYKHGFILDDVSISRLAEEDCEFELVPMEMEENADKIKTTVEKRKSTVQKYRKQLLETLNRMQENLEDPRDQEELIIARKQRSAEYYNRPGVRDRRKTYCKEYYQKNNEKFREYYKKRYQERRVEFLEYKKDYYQKHRAERLEYSKKRYVEKKQIVKGSEG